MCISTKTEFVKYALKYTCLNELIKYTFVLIIYSVSHRVSTQ